MTDKKLTYKEIIKALEYCKDCSANLNVEIIDLITCQQAEYENLKVENQSLRTAGNSLKMHYEEAQAEVERLKRELDLVIENSISARYPHCVLCGNGAILTKSLEEYDELIADISAEAYKEFAEKAKEFMHNKFKALDEYEFEYITERDIDNLAKERVGDDNA